MAGVFIIYVTVWWKLGQFCNERERRDTRRARRLFPPRSCVNDRGYVPRATVVTAQYATSEGAQKDEVPLSAVVLRKPAVLVQRGGGPAVCGGQPPGAAGQPESLWRCPVWASPAVGLTR